MWEEFQKKKRELFKLCNGKEICIWVYQLSGKFCENLFRRENKSIEHIIDNSLLQTDCERSVVLKEFDRDTHIILIAFKREEKTVDILKQLGYEENNSFVFIREWFFGSEGGNRTLSCYNWLEYKYGLDIVSVKTKDELKYLSTDNNEYSVGFDYGFVDVLDKFQFCKNDSIFDFGCGKGGALLLSQTTGVGEIGGVEYDGDLYKTALTNFEKMGMDSVEILHGDAAKITDRLDSYNYFYIYNSFVGEIFEQVIRNLEQSYRRCKRKMYLIYVNTFCHDMVIKNGIFKFSKTVRTDNYIKDVRIYCTK